MAETGENCLITGRGKSVKSPSSGHFFSATPQQSEICVKVPVFHTISAVKFW